MHVLGLKVRHMHSTSLFTYEFPLQKLEYSSIILKIKIKIVTIYK